MFTEICNDHAPIMQRKVRGTQCPWLTDQLKERMRKRDYLHKVAIRSGLSADWDTYKYYETKLTAIFVQPKKSTIKPN